MASTRRADHHRHLAVDAAETRANVIDFRSAARRSSLLRPARPWIPEDTGPPREATETSAEGRARSFWGMVWDDIMLGFALYATSFHPCSLPPIGHDAAEPHASRSDDAPLPRP